MYRLFAYWSALKPEDVEAFEEYYASTQGVRGERPDALPDRREVFAEDRLPGRERAGP